jgi:hypothetical protein
MKTNIANQDLVKALNRANECLRRLIEAGLSYDDLQTPITDPEMRARLVKFWKNPSPTLKLISGGEKIMIEALDGKATIADSVDVFKSHVDPDFVNWKLNTSGPATSKTLLDVYEMIVDANSAQIFTSLNSDLDKLVLTQAQIIRFCAKHPTWLCQKEHVTLFLIEINREYFVVYVHVRFDGLFVRVSRFGHDGVWRAEGLHRVVVPQLIS